MHSIKKKHKEYNALKTSIDEQIKAQYAYAFRNKDK